MIKKIGNYYLTQNINSATGLKVFSEEEYKLSEKAGMKRMFDNEEMYYGQDVNFASILWDSTTVGSINGKIYKIAIQLIGVDKKKSNWVLNTVVDFINKYIGKYNKHPFLSDKYIWFTEEQSVFLNKRQMRDINAINLIFTYKDIEKLR